jgi:hypothetical protein
MLNLKRTTLAFALASSAALSLLAMPGAYAGAQSYDVWSQFNNTDGGADYSANFVDGPKVPPTPEQAAQLRNFEAQMQITDGAGDYGANFVEGPKVPATPEQAAQLRNFEAQQQITDGAGNYFGGAEASTYSWGSAHHAASGDVEATSKNSDRSL